MLPGQDAADLDPDRVQPPPGDHGVRPGEVDVLEQTALGVGRRKGRAAQPPAVDGDQLARRDLAQERGADDVQCRGLTGHDESAFQLAKHQRADALRVAGRVQGLLVHEDQAERPAQSRQHLERCVLGGGPGKGGQQGGDQSGVGGGLVEQRAGHQGLGRVISFGEPGLQLQRIGQVAVVTEGDSARGGRPERRLGVLPDARSGRRVAAVADRQVGPAQRLQGRLVEDLGDQTHVFEHDDLGALADRDAGRLLAAVLQGVDAEVRELGHFLVGGPDSEDAACVLGAAVVWIEILIQPTVSAWHCLMVSPQPAWIRPPSRTWALASKSRHCAPDLRAARPKLPAYSARIERSVRN